MDGWLTFDFLLGSGNVTIRGCAKLIVSHFTVDWMETKMKKVCLMVFYSQFGN